MGREPAHRPFLHVEAYQLHQSGEQQQSWAPWVRLLTSMRIRASAILYDTVSIGVTV